MGRKGQNLSQPPEGQGLAAKGLNHGAARVPTLPPRLRARRAAASRKPPGDVWATGPSRGRKGRPDAGAEGPWCARGPCLPFPPQGAGGRGPHLEGWAGGAHLVPRQGPRELGVPRRSLGGHRSRKTGPGGYSPPPAEGGRERQPGGRGNPKRRTSSLCGGRPLRPSAPPAGPASRPPVHRAPQPRRLRGAGPENGAPGARTGLAHRPIFRGGGACPGSPLGRLATYSGDAGIFRSVPRVELLSEASGMPSPPDAKME